MYALFKICHKRFKSLFLLNQHKTHLPLEQFTCEECGKDYKIKKCFEKHKKSHEEERKKKEREE